ncbi:MAG: hypothetical protein AB7V50_08455 [Vampirovibrionia bacterium]
MKEPQVKKFVLKLKQEGIRVMRGLLDLFFNISKDEHIGLNTIRTTETNIETQSTNKDDDESNISFLNLVKQSY